MGIRHANKEHQERLSALDRFAVAACNRVGRFGFFLIIVGWTALWLSWNLLAPKEWCFDPAPAFVLWLMASNCLQIFLMPLLLIAQNIQSKHAETMAELDYEADMRAEADVGELLRIVRAMKAKYL